MSSTSATSNNRPPVPSSFATPLTMSVRVGARAATSWIGPSPWSRLPGPGTPASGAG